MGAGSRGRAEIWPLSPEGRAGVRCRTAGNGPRAHPRVAVRPATPVFLRGESSLTPTRTCSCRGRSEVGDQVVDIPDATLSAQSESEMPSWAHLGARRVGHDGGCLMSDSTPPRDSARVKRRCAREFAGARWPLAVKMVIMLPKPDISAASRWRAVGGWGGRGR